LSVRDPSLTLTQFCARLKTVLFCRAYETLAWRLRDSLGCKDCCANTNSLTYLLTYLFTNREWHTQHCAAIPATAELLFLTTRQQALLWRWIGVELGSMDWRSAMNAFSRPPVMKMRPSKCVHRGRRANLLSNIRLLKSCRSSLFTIFVSQYRKTNKQK